MKPRSDKTKSMYIRLALAPSLRVMTTSEQRPTLHGRYYSLTLCIDFAPRAKAHNGICISDESECKRFDIFRRVLPV